VSGKLAPHADVGYVDAGGFTNIRAFAVIAVVISKALRNFSSRFLLRLFIF
jgi:hypothetical protein